MERERYLLMDLKTPIVELSNVSKIYNKQIWALKKIDLKLYRGECISLLGSNGSGKTTLLRIIANNLKNTTGTINYNLEEENILRAIGLQKREQAWPNGFKVKDINDLWIRIYDINDLEWINKLKDVFGVNEIEEKYLNKLSIVRLQIYAIFLAFISKPELVLIDELSSDIDFRYEEKITNFLKEYLVEGNTVVLNSPSYYFLENLTDRVVYLNDGEIFEDLSIKEVKKEYKSVMEYTKSIFKEELIAEKKIKNKSKFFSTMNSKTETYSNNLQSIIEQLEVQENHNEKVLNRLKEVYFSILDLKTSIDNLSVSYINANAIKIISKKIKITIKLINKLTINYRYKKYHKTLNAIEKFLSKELKRTFANDKVIVNGDVLSITMSDSEKKQLDKLKEKYIKEEQKIIRRKILKQQFKKEKKLKDKLVQNSLKEDTTDEIK
ncbi:ATP-binding cassette domain-containing protein [Mesoplasma coleopterae]|uniref:ABC transporter ATP-binding protein n=1 Tax=Mesoplasma coleopterae TaxID=324078 RepID=A0A2K8P4R1_9MOLU|nr:ATP-binding cassette domain-containing protein [Mesoplasma coleopterae]ATZ20713.1 ABC transporter ATP-binding protein [Mesoplasma coleopterae]